MSKLKVGVLFGGRSPEHEISIITGIQVMEALDKNKYEVVPVYISKDGKWIQGDDSFFKPSTFTNLDSINKKGKTLIMSSDPNIRGLISEGSKLSLSKSFTLQNLDVVFPVFHGRYGEDGSIQGLFEMSGIPYVGCDVEASAIGMDKIASKRIATAIGVPVLKDISVISSLWKINRKKILSDIKNKLKFPLFIKPSRLGSSIGLNKAHDIKELEEFLDVAFFYDTKVMVEESMEDAHEINISILGNNPYEMSVCEMPIHSSEILSFEDKYTSKKGPSKGMASAKRIIPAPIKEITKNKIEKYAKMFFSEIGGQGMARIDFLISKDESSIFLNEINTLPGSVAFYLWKEVGLTFDKLVDRLITLALERSEEKDKLITTFSNNVLSGFNGSKGIKG